MPTLVVQNVLSHPNFLFRDAVEGRHLTAWAEPEGETVKVLATIKERVMALNSRDAEGKPVSVLSLCAKRQLEVGPFPISTPHDELVAKAKRLCEQMVVAFPKTNAEPMVRTLADAGPQSEPEFDFGP